MIDQNPKRSDEPVWWGLFGAGGTWFAMLTPITVLVLGILAPLGLINLSYERISHFASSFLGALFIIGTISLPMWHAMHRLHHGMHDLKIHTGTFSKIACYSTAYLFTALSVIFIFMI